MFTLRNSSLLLAGSLIAVGVSVSATAATLHVPNDQPTIQAAIDAANLILQPGLTQGSGG